jgi:hypothetical protein|tara:strand:+ start:18262 stop:19326 length:1065 start_codon:yes stop_codon:yes gene_type:complete
MSDLSAISQHLIDLSDDTGVFQHARFHVPNRAHGYCTDDNARALMAMAMLSALRPLSAAEQRNARLYAAFLDHAFQEDDQLFRNFMSYDRRWLPDEPAADAGARSVWALGWVCAFPPAPNLDRWAGDLFIRAVGPLSRSSSPRVWAFLLLGLEKIRGTPAEWPQARDIAGQLATRLITRWHDAAKPDWQWFEDELSYDNARLCEAALTAGQAFGITEATAIGLQSLEALWNWQIEDGVFHPVGHASFGKRHAPPARFDQQPLEAAAMVDACLAAAVSEPERRQIWAARALQAFDWFTGANALNVPLIVPGIGLCHDGLHPEKMNENAGAESTLAWLQALFAMKIQDKGRSFEAA